MIGRDPDKSNIVLPETELSVSRRHASITCEADGVYWIRDEGSKSRTYVNRQEVPPAGRRLAPNDIIQLGRMTLRFVLQKGARGDETQPLDPASYLAPGMPGSSSAARNRDETETIAGQS
jgi:pSer/pThr/pTyr-binding forkhead associated (FHA) protein